jgi:hypothetical protein
MENLNEKSNLMYFLFWLKQDRPGTMYGSHKIEEIWNNLPKVLDIDMSPDVLEQKLKQMNNID